MSLKCKYSDSETIENSIEELKEPSQKGKRGWNQKIYRLMRSQWPMIRVEVKKVLDYLGFESHQGTF